MKNFILLIILFNVSLFYCQGNLVFNQIISATNGININVPANKIWKIESVNFNTSVSFNTGTMQNTSCYYVANMNNRICYFQGIMFTIGGTVFKTPILQHLTQALSCASSCQATNPIALSGTTNNNNFIFPMWLNAGQNISVISGTGILISIVEFNIVP